MSEIPPVKPATLRQREYRARLRQLRLEAGWRDKRYKDPDAAPFKPYLAVQRWRLTHRDKSRLSDRVYKGMKRNPLFQRAWPEILAHYGGFCLSCGAGNNVVPDHVLPVLDDPVARNVLANLQPLCRRCNSAKRGRSDDHRPDTGLWIARTYDEDAWTPLHNTKPRARYGSNGWTMRYPQSMSPVEDATVHPVDTKEDTPVDHTPSRVPPSRPLPTLAPPLQ